jgi:hypothetical protein
MGYDCDNAQDLILVILGLVLEIITEAPALLSRLFGFHMNWKSPDIFTGQTGFFDVFTGIVSVVDLLLHLLFITIPVLSGVVGLILFLLVAFTALLSQPYFNPNGNTLWTRWRDSHWVELFDGGNVVSLHIR